METLQTLIIALPVLIFSVVCHEVAHAWVARREGDDTAYMLGRITLNPIPHLDPIGSVLVPGILALSGTGFLFGWARPVPVNSRNFRDFKRGDIRVSLAGVVVNFLLTLVFTVLLAGVYLGMRAAPGLEATWTLLHSMLVYGIGINFVLALFNLVPIPPLDGSHVFYYLLPPRVAIRYRELGRYGMLILMALLFLGLFNVLIGPVTWMTSTLVGIARSIAGVG